MKRKFYNCFNYFIGKNVKVDTIKIQEIDTAAKVETDAEKW
jgi:hypothetical protein